MAERRSLCRRPASPCGPAARSARRFASLRALHGCCIECQRRLCASAERAAGAVPAARCALRCVVAPRCCAHAALSAHSPAHSSLQRCRCVPPVCSHLVPSEAQGMHRQRQNLIRGGTRDTHGGEDGAARRGMERRRHDAAGGSRWPIACGCGPRRVSSLTKGHNKHVLSANLYSTEIQRIPWFFCVLLCAWRRWSHPPRSILSRSASNLHQKV